MFWWNIIWWNDMNVVNTLFFFCFFSLLGTKHLHVLQWAGRSSGNYIVQFLPCPQKWLGRLFLLGSPQFTIRSASPLIWHSFMKLWMVHHFWPTIWSWNNFRKPCLDPMIWDEIVNFGLQQDYVHNFGFKLHEYRTLGCNIHGMWRKESTLCCGGHFIHNN